MHFKGLDLNLLVALEVLLRERSITRAGERLGLSQPATSGALARLREYFNDPLLVQVGRQLMLTPLAQTLMGPVGEVLQQIQATIATKARFDPMASDRRFSIMASDYAFTVFMPEVLRRVEKEAPKVTLELRQIGPSWQDELNRGDIDFLIIPEPFHLSSQPTQPLFEDTFSCVVWKDNPHVGNELTVEQYFALGHVGITLSGAHAPSFDEWVLKRGGHARRVEVVAPTFNLVPLLVVGTHRIATIWTRLAQHAVTQLPLKLMKPPLDIPAFREVLQWPAHRETEPGCVWLRDLMRERAAALAAPGPHQRSK